MDYEKWLEEMKYHEGITMMPSSIICRNDGKDIWADEKGKSFPALSNKLIWEAGYKQCLKELKGEIK